MSLGEVSVVFCENRWSPGEKSQRRGLRRGATKGRDEGALRRGAAKGCYEGVLLKGFCNGVLCDHGVLRVILSMAWSSTRFTSRRLCCCCLPVLGGGKATERHGVVVWIDDSKDDLIPQKQCTILENGLKGEAIH